MLINNAVTLSVITDGGFLPRHNIGAWAFICGQLVRYGTMQCTLSTYAEFYAYLKAVEHAKERQAQGLIIISDCEGAVSVMARKTWTKSAACNKLILAIRQLSVGIGVGYRCVERREVTLADAACSKAFRKAGYGA